jgi:hypothetical protein
MLEALEFSESKLREYYAKTDAKELGDVYAHGTILAPQHKLQFFKSKDWAGGWDASYLKSLQDRIKGYQSTDDSISRTRALTYVSELDRVLASTSRFHQDKDELTQFLEGGKALDFLTLFVYYFALAFFSLSSYFC